MYHAVSEYQFCYTYNINILLQVIEFVMASTQKCDSCNQIVNEMLMFVQNNLRSMDSIVLARVCSSSYSKHDIEEATSVIRNISKEKFQETVKGEYKDMYDIIETMKALDPEITPIFVARSFNKLPVATNANQLLLKENLSLENEIKELNHLKVIAKQMYSELAKIACGQKVYIAKYDYKADAQDEVTFAKGELITDVSRIDNGWMSGLVLRTGRSGMLPANYVELYPNVVGDPMAIEEMLGFN